MKHVYKYPLRAPAATVLELPYQSKPLHVGLDPQGVPSIWIEVPDTSPPAVPAGPSETRLFDIFGTGWPIKDSHVYVGTFRDGPYIWHVYETTPRVVGL